MPFPKIWDILDEFKSFCKSRGWKAYKNDNLIEADSEHHKFFWIRILYPDTFKKVVANPLCSICEGISYRTVKLSYIAWVLSEIPYLSIRLYMIKEVPSLLTKVAIYALNQAYKGEPTCLKLNETKSVVFHESEVYKYKTWD